MGTNAKLLLQLRRHLSHYDRWNGEFYDAQVDTWCSSTDEPGRPGLVTIYSGGSYGAAQTGPGGASASSDRDRLIRMNSISADPTKASAGHIHISAPTRPHATP